MGWQSSAQPKNVYKCFTNDALLIFEKGKKTTCSAQAKAFNAQIISNIKSMRFKELFLFLRKENIGAGEIFSNRTFQFRN